MHNRQAPDQRHHRLRPTDHVVFGIGDGLPHDIDDDDDSLSTSGSSWDHLAGFFISAFSQMRTPAPAQPLLRGEAPFSGQESDYVSDSDSVSVSVSVSDDRAPTPPRAPLLLRFPSFDPSDFFNADAGSDSDDDAPIPAQPAAPLLLRFPSFDPNDFFNSDSDSDSATESEDGAQEDLALPIPVLPAIDVLNAPQEELLIEAIVAIQDDREESVAPAAAERNEGHDVFHFLWQNTVYTSIKGFLFNSATAVLGGYGTTALAAQAPSRAVDAVIATVQTFLSMRRVLNRGLNKKRTYAEASWTEISAEIGASSATALLGGAIAYFNPSSNVFKRIADVVVGTGEAYYPNLVMKFSPEGGATSTFHAERGHAYVTNVLKYAIKRALKEGAFPDALAAPDADALKGANPFMMQYLYKSLIDALVDLCVDVYVSLAYKETAKHLAGIPYAFKDRKSANSDDPFMARAQKNFSKAGIKAGYKNIGSSVSDLLVSLPNALGTDVPDGPKNIVSVLGAIVTSVVAGEVDAHNASNAAKGDNDNNVDEQHYENQPAPSTDMELVTIRL